MASTISANGIEIRINEVNHEDYISLTDIAKKANPDEPRFVIQNWLRNRSTIEFLGLWETLNNSDFNRVEFEAFKNSSGSNAFVLSPQRWIEKTGAIGIVSKSGRYGGTYAHTDIAFEFASWISPEFKLYIIKDYQRLKKDESARTALGWDVKRELAKANYKLHTDAIKDNLIPEDLSKREATYVYANEADVLNVAVFGITAKQWRDANPSAKGNIRDNADVNQLIVIANLENLNSIFINQGMTQRDRIIMLNQIARQQLIALTSNASVNRLSNLTKK